MRRNGRLLIVLGVVLLLGAVVLALFALSGGEDDTPSTGGQAPQAQDVTIVVSRRDIDPHTVLRQDDVEAIVVRADTVTGNEARSIGEVIGLAYRSALVENQRIMRDGLEVSGIAQELEPGKRAMSLPVDRNNLVAGLVRQDDRVDIIYKINLRMTRLNPTLPLELPDDLSLTDLPITLEGYDFEGVPDGPVYPYPGEPGSRFTVTEAQAGNPVARIVLQNLRILRVVQPSSTAQSSSSQGGDFLVLEVSAEDAELLHMMQTVGTFQVVLRGSSDDETLASRGLNMEILVTEYGLPIPGSITLPGPGAQ